MVLRRGRRSLVQGDLYWYFQHDSHTQVEGQLTSPRLLRWLVRPASTLLFPSGCAAQTPPHVDRPAGTRHSPDCWDPWALDTGHGAPLRSRVMLGRNAFLLTGRAVSAGMAYTLLSVGRSCGLTPSSTAPRQRLYRLLARGGGHLRGGVWDASTNEPRKGMNAVMAGGLAGSSSRTSSFYGGMRIPPNLAGGSARFWDLSAHAHITSSCFPRRGNRPRINTSHLLPVLS